MRSQSTECLWRVSVWINHVTQPSLESRSNEFFSLPQWEDLSTFSPHYHNHIQVQNLKITSKFVMELAHTCLIDLIVHLGTIINDLILLPERNIKLKKKKKWNNYLIAVWSRIKLQIKQEEKGGGHHNSINHFWIAYFGVALAFNLEDNK